MNEKSAETLELPKILEQLARHTTFSGGRALALASAPTPDVAAAIELQKETSEARRLLANQQDVSMGGIFDVRAEALSCQRGVILEPYVLMNLRSTLRRATLLKRAVGKVRETYPLLSNIADTLEECKPLQDEIGRIFDDSGVVKDSASTKLAIIRREMRISFDRLQTKITNIATSPSNAKFLQESIVTQRNGRYVVPLKAEFKGRIPGVVHDQSASGATLFIEPLSTVELNNTYRELQLQEENEIRRILAAVCEMVGNEAERIVVTIDTLAYIDLIFARAKYADALDAIEPKLVAFRDNMPHPRHPGGTIKLYQARHPLLNPSRVVPIDVEIDDETYILVITGPNTGGKTVALKTIGLLTLMAQCGLHLPAATGSTLSVFEDIYADIGDEQSIEQSLSTFSSHMTNIIDILEVANRRSLVILDELGAGTDPAEGSALARAILSHFLAEGITTLVTTHHPELKAYSYNHAGARNASVEFNLETLAPTYRLIVGLPGRSNALAIATRLGLPEPIITEARGMITTEDLKVDNLLDEIHKSRDEIRMALNRAQTAEDDAKFLRDELQERLNTIAEERQRLLTEARERAEAELADLQREIRHLRRQLQAAGQPLEVIEQVTTAARELEEFPYFKPAEPLEEVANPEQKPTFRLGDSVWVTALNSEGQISEIAAEEVEVQIGRLRVRAKLNEIESLSRSERMQKRRENQKKSMRTSARPLERPDIERPRPASPGLELDLRGSRVEEAMSRVESYLDAAYLAGLPFVRIIHGKGTGALRTAVREIITTSPLVAKSNSGSEKEGGDGVTIVHFVSQN